MMTKDQRQKTKERRGRLAFVFRRSTFKQGFTLLETIIALSLILAAMVGPVTVVTRSISSFPSAKNRLAALNLSQEGIEIIRLVRENNILCDQKWDDNPSGGKLNGIWEVDATKIDAETLPCGKGTSIKTPHLSVPPQDPKWGLPGQRLHRDSATGLFGYDGAETTVFRRTVTVRLHPNLDPAPDQDINANDQMDVISKVWWDERGVRKEVELRERLYNWR